MTVDICQIHPKTVKVKINFLNAYKTQNEILFIENVERNLQNIYKQCKAHDSIDLLKSESEIHSISRGLSQSCYKTC